MQCFSFMCGLRHRLDSFLWSGNVLVNVLYWSACISSFRTEPLVHRCSLTGCWKSSHFCNRSACSFITTVNVSLDPWFRTFRPFLRQPHGIGWHRFGPESYRRRVIPEWLPFPLSSKCKCTGLKCRAWILRSPPGSCWVSCSIRRRPVSSLILPYSAATRLLRSPGYLWNLPADAYTILLPFLHLGMHGLHLNDIVIVCSVPRARVEFKESLDVQLEQTFCWNRLRIAVKILSRLTEPWTYRPVRCRLFLVLLWISICTWLDL